MVLLRPFKEQDWAEDNFNTHQPIKMTKQNVKQSGLRCRGDYHTHFYLLLPTQNSLCLSEEQILANDCVAVAYLKLLCMHNLGHSKDKLRINILYLDALSSSIMHLSELNGNNV